MRRHAGNPGGNNGKVGGGIILDEAVNRDLAEAVCQSALTVLPGGILPICHWNGDRIHD